MIGTAIHKTKPTHILMLMILTLVMVLPGLASLPVIDRDEARYAQASVQMVESGDYMNIRFQTHARNKKPAGIYWLQASALKAFSVADKRKIWVHRLPSVLGALLAVLATYWGGAKLIGRDKAFISAALLATSLLFVFEAHIAKTDAMLCGLSACIFAALARLRVNENSNTSLPIWLFWLTLGGSIMIKGPILLAILTFTFLGFLIWERSLSWAKPLIKPLPIIMFFLIWVPWAIGIYIATDGAFFQESLGKDLGGKLISAQEKHPGPPGYHAAFIWVMLWPASLFILPTLAYTVKTLRAGKTQNPHIFNTLQLCLLWIAPFWILIELMPTKLPHYSLPLYPAICLMIGTSLSVISETTSFKKSRIINSILFFLASAVIIGSLTYLSFEYGTSPQKIIAIIMAVLSGMTCVYGVFSMLKSRIKPALISLICAGLIISFTGYQLLLSNFESFNTSARIAAELGGDLPRHSGKILTSQSYTEPSLVYNLGTDILLGGYINPLDIDALKAGRIILIDNISTKQKNYLLKFKNLARLHNICLSISEPIHGFNYSKGDAVEIYIVQKTEC